MSERIKKNAVKTTSNSTTVRPSVKTTRNTGASTIVASQKPSTLPEARSKKPTKPTVTTEPKIGDTRIQPKQQLKLKTTRNVVTTLQKTSVKNTKTTAVYDPQHKKNAQVPTTRSQKNVMNTVHNVTVISPSRSPRTNKEATVIPRNIQEALQMANVTPVMHRDRTQTRTLEPDEVLVLNKRQDVPSAIAPAIFAMPSYVHKEPIAFNINMNYELEATESGAIVEPKPSAISSSASSIADDSYEDDFESYESDFDTCTSSSSSELDHSKSSAGASNTNHADEIEEATSTSGNKTLGYGGSDVDSGMYELKMRTNEMRVEQLHVDSGQPDSGFCLSSSSPVRKTAVQAESAHSRRVQQLMNKITLDTMSYVIFDMKPVPYEQYMRMFGHRNGTQMNTQTPHRGSDQDVQTDDVPLATAWTQHPAHISGRTHEHRQGCGRVDVTISERHAISPDDDESPHTIDNWADFDVSLLGLASFNNQEHNIRFSNNDLLIDLNRLSMFLHQSESTIASICSLSARSTNSLIVDGSVAVPGSRGYRPLQFVGWDNTLNGYRVRLVVGDDRSDVVFAVHVAENRPYACTLVSVWKLADGYDRPMYVLRCWSPVTCLTVDEHRDGVIYGGLEDGCIAIWNLMQPTGLIDNTHLPCQLIGPSSADSSTPRAINMGALISIRTSPTTLQNASDQIYTLHENGLLSAWTVVPISVGSSQLSTVDPSTPDCKQQLAPWTLFKLVQSAALNLLAINAIDVLAGTRQMSGFQRTLSLFENNLFSDVALQELQTSDTATPVESTALRCTDLLVTAAGDLIVATNRPHLMHCTVSLHSDAVSHIRIADDRQSPYTFATRLASIGSSTVTTTIAVGLSDGSVKIICDSKSYAHSGRHRRDDDCNLPDGEFTQADLVLAKSCTIQNMIEEERPARTQSRKPSAEDISCVADLGDALQPLRLRNHLTLLHGLALNGGAVCWMAHAPGTNCLLVLSDDGRMRRFDIGRMQQMMDGALRSRTGLVNACGLCLGGQDVGDKMVVLTSDGDIQVHTLGN